MKSLTYIQFKGLKYNFARFVEDKEAIFDDYVEELDFYIKNQLNNTKWEVYLSPREFCFLEDEFILWAAESGRDREACYDYEKDHYKFICDTLQTENWRTDETIN